MTRPADLGNLKTNEWDQLQELTDRFEAAWQQADSVELSQYLPAEGEPLRAIAFHELIKTDLEIRWRKGQIVGLELYMDQYPELGSMEDVPVPLIYEEYRVRHLYGDKPQLGTYSIRFPDQYADLQRLIEANPINMPTNVPTHKEEPVVPAVATAKTANRRTLDVGGGYEMIKCIGRGSFGEVWRAEAPGGVEVAVKIIRRPIDHRESRREREALETVKRLRHPLLLQVNAFWALEDQLVIAMELADGNLRDRLRECRQAALPGVPLAELLVYFRETAEALDFLHSEKVQHRDVKPDNILIIHRHAKLADFGLARALESRGMVTATGSGTPPYMAPEVWRGRVCEHSDQYSLASSYAEMRLNRRLYADRELMQVMLGHVKKEPDLSPLSVAEQRVIFKALSMEPEHRYPSCSAFVRALDDVVGAEAKRGESRPVSDVDGARRTEQAEASSAEVVTVAPSRTEQPAPGEPAWRMPRSQPRSGVPGTEPGWRVSSPGPGASSNFGMILGIIGLLGLAVIVGLVVFFLVQK